MASSDSVKHLMGTSNYLAQSKSYRPFMFCDLKVPGISRLCGVRTYLSKLLIKIVALSRVMEELYEKNRDEDKAFFIFASMTLNLYA